MVLFSFIFSPVQSLIYSAVISCYTFVKGIISLGGLVYVIWQKMINVKWSLPLVLCVLYVVYCAIV